MIQASWAPWTKYWTVLTATLLTCVLLYEFGVRRFSATRLIFGMKPKRVVAPQDLCGEKRSAVV